MLEYLLFSFVCLMRCFNSFIAASIFTEMDDSIHRRIELQMTEKLWLQMLSVFVSSCFFFFFSSPRPWISWASWQRQSLWQWRSCTVALTPLLLQEESMSSWCDNLMDRSSVPLFTSASASWVCCAPRRKLLVFFSVSVNSLTYSSLSLLLVLSWYMYVLLIFRWTLR